MVDPKLIRTHIMVPLDGSELAECALPAAAHIASALHATLVLVRITPPLTLPPAAWNGIDSAQLYQDMVDEAMHAAEVYLEGKAQPLRNGGLAVQTVTEQGLAAPTLVDLLARLQIGLVVMTTHGRVGMARFALGSVADALTRGCHVPVLLLRPLIEERTCEQLDHALVPLDGSNLAEAALELTAALSGPLVHTITLLRVVPARDGRATVSALVDAERYLEKVVTRLVGQVAEQATVETRVVTGDPAEQIIRRAGTNCDLVIMATHGETGTRRWALGSVADRVLHDTGTPIVLIQPQRDEEQAPRQQGSAVEQ